MVTQSKTISYLSFFSAHAGSDSNHVVTFSSWIPHTQFNFITTKSLRISFPAHLNTVFLNTNNNNNNHNRPCTTHSTRNHHHTTAVTTVNSDRWKAVSDVNTNLSNRRLRMILRVVLLVLHNNSKIGNYGSRPASQPSQSHLPCNLYSKTETMAFVPTRRGKLVCMIGYHDYDGYCLIQHSIHFCAD
jgi:hypothetical protein